MKKILLILVLILTFSCHNDDDCEFEVIDVLNVSYDSQDNLVKINDGDWETSWNLDTFEGLNPVIAIRHGYLENEIRISSEIYIDLPAVSINGLLTYAELRQDGDWYCHFPNMADYMNDTDMFYFKITAIKIINE